MPQTQLPKTPVLPHLPALQESLAEGSLSEQITLALKQATDIDGLCFRHDAAQDWTGTTLNFSGCVFERCTLSGWAFKRVGFTDCRFSHCDLSGLKLQNVTLHRVQLEDCRLTGTELMRASVTDTTFQGCAADYLALSECKAQRAVWRGSRLRESLWQDVSLKDAVLDQCDLTSAQFRYTPLANVSLATCTLDALQVDPVDLRGVSVSALQALQLCGLFGIRIEE